jgi:hypothetical protein
MQSVAVDVKVASLNPVNGKKGILDTTLSDKVCQ